MKNKFAKTLALALAFALLVGLSACGGGTESKTTATNTTSASTTTAKTAADGDPVKMRMMWWGPDTRHEATLKAIELYKKVKPNVTFTTEYLGWDGYWNKLVVLAASNTMPDVLQMDAQYIDNYVSKNQLADISSIDLGGVVPEQTLENLKVGGKLYTVPLGYNGAGMVYNKTELEAAGITLPKKGWTWDDMFAYIDEAREKLPKGKYPMFDFSDIWEQYQLYQVSMGGGPVIDGSRLNLDKNLWLSMMERMDKYRKEGKVPPVVETLSFVENDVQHDPMASGKVMLSFRTVGSVGALASLMPNAELGIVNCPTGSNGGGWAQPTIFFCVGANSPHIKEAMEFERWFVTDTAAGESLMTVRGLPISDEVYGKIKSKLNPADILGKGIYDVAVSNKPSPFYPSPAQFNEFVARPSGIYKSTMEQYMFGKLTLQEAYDKLIKSGEELGNKTVK